MGARFVESLELATGAAHVVEAGFGSGGGFWHVEGVSYRRQCDTQLVRMCSGKSMMREERVWWITAAL